MFKCPSWFHFLHNRAIIDIYKICCLVHYTTACAYEETVEHAFSGTVILYLPVCGSVMMDLVNISNQYYFQQHHYLSLHGNYLYNLISGITYIAQRQTYVVQN